MMSTEFAKDTMEVKVVRSRRRLRTVSARIVKNTLLVNAPLMLSQERLDKIVSDFKVKFEKRRLKDDLDKRDNLTERAQRIKVIKMEIPKVKE